MAECRCDAIGREFDEAHAADILRRYREQGPDPSTRALLSAITDEDVRGRTLLDIGGGVGAVQHELLERGLASVQEVEASAACIAACTAEAEARGHGDRIAHVWGDFESVRSHVLPADIVTLDRSVCCWPRSLALIDESARLARRLYALVYPRDAWWVRCGWRTWGNLQQVMQRGALRLQTPRARDVEAMLKGQGLERRHHETVGVWQVALFERPTADT